jgi:cytochrome P450
MSNSNLALPPGPRSPKLWQLLRYAHNPLPFLEECGRRFGPAFTIRFAGYGPFVMLSDSDAIREVFRGDPRTLHSGEANEFLSLTVGKNSVLVLDEETHARQRRVLVPPFKGERMRRFFPEMRAAAQTEIQTWGSGQQIEMLPAMRRITLRVILQSVLGLPAGPELAEIETQVERLLAMSRVTRYSIAMIPFIPFHSLKRFRLLPFFRQLRRMDEALFAFIERYRRDPTPLGQSVFADLLTATHEDGQSLSDQEIRDIIATLIMAGHDTTSIALAWALEQIASHAEATARITAELEEVVGDGDFEPGHMDRLHYLDAAIRESMRIRTILPFVSRLTKQPFRAGGRDYPAGVTLAPCIHLVHRRPDLYPEPNLFRPERFLERKFDSTEWLPFGGGSRVCLGMAFSLYETKVVLAEMFSKMEFRPAAGQGSRAVRQGLSLAPHDGVPLIVERCVRPFPAQARSG